MDRSTTCVRRCTLSAAEPSRRCRSRTSSFDLIWALSVFTHLVDPMRWLAELHRVLAPGGQLIASYMGRHNGEAFTREPWDEDRTGIVILRRDQGWEHGGPMVLMSDWWVDAHWGRAFEPLRREPVHGQTWALLRRREVRSPPRNWRRPPTIHGSWRRWSTRSRWSRPTAPGRWASCGGSTRAR